MALTRLPHFTPQSGVRPLQGPPAVGGDITSRAIFPIWLQVAGFDCF
jgi:hypothetical protein